MITITHDKCIQCGICVRICHQSCLILQDGKLQINHAVCSTCTQCIAICPRQALTWDGTPPVAFDPTRLPSPEQLDELFKERRSIRFFKPDRVDRALLTEIVQYGLYAPTHNVEKMRIIVVDDAALIDEFDHILSRYVTRIYNTFFKFKIIGQLAGLMGFAHEYKLSKPKLESVLERGSAFHHPAAMIFVINQRWIPLASESAQYVLANMMYYAQAKELGTCLWANGPMFIGKNKSARARLGLQKQEQVFGTMLIGYPDVSFRNKVTGRTLPIEWK